MISSVEITLNVLILTKIRKQKKKEKQSIWNMEYGNWLEYEQFQ